MRVNVFARCLMSNCSVHPDNPFGKVLSDGGISCASELITPRANITKLQIKFSRLAVRDWVSFSRKLYSTIKASPKAVEINRQ